MGRTWTVPGKVTRVVDGDTVELILDLGWRITLTAKCRIAGINAPEASTAAGRAAKAYAATWLPVGAEVIFTSQQLDKYGRPLGALTWNGNDFAAAMLAAGHAVPMT